MKLITSIPSIIIQVYEILDIPFIDCRPLIWHTVGGGTAMKNKFRHPLVKKIFLSELAAKQLIQLDVSEEEIVDSIHASLQDALLEGLTEFFTTDDQYFYIFQRTGPILTLDSVNLLSEIDKNGFLITDDPSKNNVINIMDKLLAKGTADYGIDHLSFTVRTYNTLVRNGIRTFSQLKALSEKDLIEMKNLPQKSIDEIATQLEAVGLKLSKD